MSDKAAKQSTGGLASGRTLRHALLAALAAWLATRAAYVAFTFFDLAYYNPLPIVGCTFDPHCTGKGLLTNWFRFDAVWYVNIARDGYFSDTATAFFPLFPALIRVLIAITGTSHEVLDALVVANLAGLAALVAAAAVAAVEPWSGRPSTAVLATAAYPLAFFLAAPYTEPLFLALAAFSLLLARRGRLLPAAGLGFLAALTRPTGAALMLPLAWEAAVRTGTLTALTRRRFGVTPRALVTLVSAAGAVPLGFAAYSAYLYLTRGAPLLWQKAQVAWGRSSTLPWDTVLLQLRHLRHATGELQAVILVDSLAVALAVGVCAAGWRRLPFSFVLYEAGLVALILVAPEPAAGDVIPSAGRFLAVSFPVFLLVARWADEHLWVACLWIAGGFLIQAVLLARFMAWRFVG